jgi:hypothetical protein
MEVIMFLLRKSNETRIFPEGKRMILTYWNLNRLGFILALLVISLNSCNAQQGNKKELKNEPKTSVKVNKTYDKNGNLIGYDSTYSYVYSSMTNDSLMADSALTQFKQMFNQKYFFSNRPFFDEMFFNDSLMNNEFLKPDFFQNQFMQNMGSMDELFMQMDSIKNSFYKDYYQVPQNKKGAKNK